MNAHPETAPMNQQSYTGTAAADHYAALDGPRPHLHRYSPEVQHAIDWWERRDGFGGFQGVAAILFPGWMPRIGHCRAPHRQGAMPLVLRRNDLGVVRFKDVQTGQQGTLLDFVMLKGMDRAAAERWLIEFGPGVEGIDAAKAEHSAAARNDEARMPKHERMTKPEARKPAGEVVGGDGNLERQKRETHTADGAQHSDLGLLSRPHPPAASCHEIPFSSLDIRHSSLSEKASIDDDDAFSALRAWDEERDPLPPVTSPPPEDIPLSPSLSTSSPPFRIKDADDYLYAYGPEALLALSKTAKPVEYDDPAPSAKVETPAERAARLFQTTKVLEGPVAGVVKEPLIRFFNPAEIVAFAPSEASVLVGDCHIMPGEVFLIAGEPGVGKSRAATAFAVCGATGRPWFGMTVHRRFRTMIIQTENSRHRLKQEFEGLDAGALEQWILVSEPPPYGLTLDNPEFLAAIARAIEEFQPDVVFIDPWNSAAKDDKQRDYAAAFDKLRAMLPTGQRRPALGIVAHTRKIQLNERRKGGTGLMNCISGSHMLFSVPRAVFIMLRATEDESDDRIVWCNPKNNNGEMHKPTAWHRGVNGYTPCEGFDWEAFDKEEGSGKRNVVTLEHLRTLFKEGERKLELSDAVRELAALVDITEKSSYFALSEKGKFAQNIVREGKQVSFKR